MPDPPTPSVNGHVLSVPALQASMSMLSLEPAARMFGWLASTATAGSFCLFCENGVTGLPTVTNASVDAALTGTAGNTSTAAIAARNNRETRLIQGPPFWPSVMGLGGIDAGRSHKRAV